MTRGVNAAIAYLNSFFPITLIPDKLFQRAGCDGKLSAIEKGLRRARAIGKVKVIYEKDERGDEIAHYQGVPSWTKPKDSVAGIAKSVEKVIDAHKPTPAASPFPAVYFYSIYGKEGYSPFFTTLEEMHKHARAIPGPVIYQGWTGSHENPVAVVV